MLKYINYFTVFIICFTSGSIEKKYYVYYYISVFVVGLSSKRKKILFLFFFFLETIRENIKHYFIKGN